ncbi:hypothetical protein JVU11DRAFT_6267 [Chiua virens]|nr:hypothetical protein JVU11DRAFT_6267 [Chiua virens]
MQLPTCRAIGALQEGQIKATASNWPAIFYKENIYDLNDRLKGLFCGHAAFQIYLYLFVGPTAAATDPITYNASRPAKNHLWGLSNVTPVINAYMHVVVHLH